MRKVTKKRQSESHDWLGDAAESYVRYLFAREGFHVYGASKWHGDIVAYDSMYKNWWKVEVKSTDRSSKAVYRGSMKKLWQKKEPDFLVLVRFSQDKKIEVEFKSKSASRKYNKEGDIRDFLSVFEE